MVWRQLRDRTRLRFSAALPLGINRNERHSKADWNYPNNRQPLPYFFYLGGANAGEVAIFDAERRVAGLPEAGVRLARLCESQEQSPFTTPRLSYSACRPLPRAASPLGDKAGGSKNRKSTAP